MFWLTVITFPIIVGCYGFARYAYALILDIKSFFHNYKV